MLGHKIVFATENDLAKMARASLPSLLRVGSMVTPCYQLDRPDTKIENSLKTIWFCGSKNFSHFDILNRI